MNNQVNANIIIKLIKKGPKVRVGGYEFISELYHVEEHTIPLIGKRDHISHALNTFLLGLYINGKKVRNIFNKKMEQ